MPRAQLALSEKAVLAVPLMLSAEEVVEKYQLQPLDQEGGFFRRMWSSEVYLNNELFGSQYPGGETRETATLIHYLLTRDAFSAMHRLRSDEHWFYHLGDPMEILLLHPDGTGETVVLGPELKNEHHVHTITPAQSWQGAKLLPQDPGKGCGYCLTSCMVIPAFVWDDFELADAGELLQSHPNFAEAIITRTRYNPAKGEK